MNVVLYLKVGHMSYVLKIHSGQKRDLGDFLSFRGAHKSSEKFVSNCTSRLFHAQE